MPFEVSEGNHHLARIVHETPVRAMQMLEQSLRSPRGLPPSVSLHIRVRGRPAKEAQLTYFGDPRDFQVALTFQRSVLNHLVVDKGLLLEGRP